MEFVLIVVVLGLIPAAIASGKGQNFFIWWLYGAAFFIIAFIHALVLKSPTQKAIETRMANLGVAEELERFVRLKDQGIITEAEFKAKKAELLAGA